VSIASIASFFFNLKNLIFQYPRFHHDAFANQYEGQELQNALFAHSRMGYNFIISKVRVGLLKNSLLKEIDRSMPTATDIDTVSVDVTITQKGIAPFYYPLSLQLHCNDVKRNETQIRFRRGVELIVDQNSWKTFSFVNVTKDCLTNLTFTLDSPHIYPERPVQFAQRGQYNNETTSSVSILNVPLPTNQNLVDAMEYYKMSAAPSAVPPDVGRPVTASVFPSNTPTSLPTLNDAVVVAPSLSPTILTVAYASPTSDPTTTISPTRGRVLAPINPPIKAFDNTITPTPIPSSIAVNHTNNLNRTNSSSSTNSTNVTTNAPQQQPQQGNPPMKTSHTEPPSNVNPTTLVLIGVIGSLICVMIALLLYRYYTNRIRPKRRSTTLPYQQNQNKWTTTGTFVHSDHVPNNVDSEHHHPLPHDTTESDGSIGTSIDVMTTALQHPLEGRLENTTTIESHRSTDASESDITTAHDEYHDHYNANDDRCFMVESNVPSPDHPFILPPPPPSSSSLMSSSFASTQDDHGALYTTIREVSTATTTNTGTTVTSPDISSITINMNLRNPNRNVHRSGNHKHINNNNDDDDDDIYYDP
jgi:hypothetical protein